jgi:hypothetical protein
VVKIPHSLWGLILYYCTHKNSLLVHILNQTNTAYPHILHIHFNIILQFITRIPKGLFFSVFPTKMFTQSLRAGVSACPQHFEIEKECILEGLLSQVRSHLKILVVTRVTSSKFHTQYPQILGATWLTWHPGFDHPCYIQSFKCLCHTWKQHWKSFSRSYCNLPHCFTYFIVIQAEYGWVFQPWHFILWQKLIH